MPKESVKFNFIPDEKTNEVHRLVRTSVGWGKELGRVNVTVEYEALDGRMGESMTAFTTDRHAINRLIRLLRKARDQAFGQDA